LRAKRTNLEANKEILRYSKVTIQIACLTGRAGIKTSPLTRLCCFSRDDVLPVMPVTIKTNQFSSLGYEMDSHFYSFRLSGFWNR
jgi:hypothetical protein